MKQEFRTIREFAYDWDERPHEYFNFTGRVLEKYGLPYIRQKIHFRHNYIIDEPKKDADIIVPFINEIKQSVAEKELQAARNYVAKEQNVVDMEVPAVFYDSWLNSVPSKYFAEYKNKKQLLDEYLSTFNSYERNRVIKIMCENSSSRNYTTFLDLSPDVMSTQQFIIYKDIISFYEQRYLKDVIDAKELWNKYNERNEEVNKKQTPNALYDEFDSDEYGDMTKLKAILADQSGNEEAIAELKQRIEDLTRSQDASAQANVQYQTPSASSQLQFVPYTPRVSLERTNNVITRDISPAKTLMFTPQTTIINSNYAFGANNAYEPNHFRSMALRGLGLSNTSIAKVGYVDNIESLINERNAKVMANQRLVDEIIQKQIAYNSQFSGTNVGDSTINPTYTGPQNSIFNNRNADPFNSNASAYSGQPDVVKPVLIKKSNVAASQQPQANRVAGQYGAPMLAQKPVNIGNYSQQPQANEVPVQQQASPNEPVYSRKLNLNTDSPMYSTQPKMVLSRFNQQPVGEPSSNVTRGLNVGINKPTTTFRKDPVVNKDVVGVYKIHTKDIDAQPSKVEKEPEKVLVGMTTRKL